ncbi:MAG: acyl-CoA dehydratase activase-related protein [Candidatus Gastranaerophilales bacterium]|nr:acyl-CoA dehydratase activase-related protein [Candidatus Gastranaerophilales bacterium]
MEIGIPRALSFYNFYPFWFGFFNDLGIKIVLSDRTTKETMSTGAALVVSETCLPVKVYAGHILNLLEKGVDKIFCPSIQSIAPKIYNCSKIRGLPDLIRNVIKREFTLIEATLDKSEKKQGLYEFLAEAVAPFGITDSNIIRKASKAGWRMYNNFNVMTRAGVPYKRALKYALEDKVIISQNNKSYPISIAVIAHGYNLYDERVSMKIFDKLEKLDVKAYTAEQLSQEQMQEGIAALDSKVYWANEYEISGAAAHYIQESKIDGVITINAFGCGPDSLMIEKISRYAKEQSKPILNLSIDEQTGEAGFVTRIEAFTDMLFRKKRSKIVNNIEIDEDEMMDSNSIRDRINTSLNAR